MSKSLRQLLTPEDLRELAVLLPQAWKCIPKLNKLNSAARRITYPRLPSAFSESLVVHCGPTLFPKAKNIHLGGGREADVVFDASNGTKKVEVKATGSKEFQQFGPKDINADFLVWIAFGPVFEKQADDPVRIYVLAKPKRVFPDKTKITLARFKKQAAGKLACYEAKLSDLIDGRVRACSDNLPQRF